MPRRSGTLLWRLWALGIAQLAVLAATATAVFVLTGPERPRQEEEESVRATVIREVERARERPDQLTAELAELRARYDIDLTVYDDGGAVVATTTEPPIPARPDRAPPRLDRPPRPPGPGGPPPPVFAMPLEAGGSVVIRFADRHTHWLGPLITLLFGLVVVGLGAFLTARWIGRPLERLEYAARAVGEGDLRARTGLARSDELGQVGHAFDEMADRLENLVRAERELLANVSHELRTPLARIRVALDLASEGDPESARAAIADIATDLAELESILDDILVAMRFEAGRSGGSGGLPLSTLKQTPAATIAERAAERFRARHPDRPLEVTLGDGAPPIIVDPMLLRRVIDNLLENAHKYTPDGSRAIDLRVGAREDAALFEVQDRGIGIGDDDLPHVFDPFFRVEKSRTRGAGGVGLGLTLAKRIVEAHGGTIDVVSRLGEGTTVSVIVPGR